MQLSSLEITEDNQHTSTGRNKERARGEGGKPGDLGRHFRERHCLNLSWEGPADQLDYLSKHNKSSSG